jgi:Tfp pilus assembly protein PilF
VPKAAAPLATLLLLFPLLGCPAGPGDSDGLPEEVIRHNNLGTSYLSQQKWGEAIAEFEKGLATLPEDPVLRNNLAVALLQQGKPDEAEASLRRGLEADPDHPYTHYNLGLIARNRGNFEGAATHFAAVAAHDASEVFTQYNLGSALARIDRAEDAEQALRKALELNPTHVSSLYALGRLLVQTERQDEGLELITLSQEIRSRSGLDEAVGHQYGEQGPYAMGADYPGGGLLAPEPIEVSFAGELSVGSDVLTVHRASPEAAPALLTGVDLELPSGYATAVALSAGDLDGDSRSELLVVASAGESATGPDLIVAGHDETGAREWWSSPVARMPRATAQDGVRLGAVDRDHDGDLDLFACWGGDAAGCLLATNDGSGSFTTGSSEHGLEIPAGSRVLGIEVVDYDNDRDIDLAAVTAQGVHLFSNNRDGTFTDVADQAGIGQLAVESGRFADLDKDGWMDLVAGTGEGPRVLRNVRGRFETATPLDPSGTSGAGPALPLDFDNDGFIDVVAGRDGLALFRNEGRSSWSRVADAIPAMAASPTAAFDVDADGDLDLVVVGEESGVLVNEGGNANNWMSIEPRGVGDNDFGIGTKVEVLAGALRQKFEVTSPLPLHVGLGSREQAEAVRLLWPGGVLQDELNQPAGQVASIEQLDRKGTSCPLLYAWRDGGYRFVTDFLGGCAIGYQHARGVFSTPDTDEYVKIEGGLTERDGKLHVRLNNQLEEVIWFDQTQLVVVDHPQGTEVFPNERLMPGPPFPEFELFASSDVRPVRSAVDPATGHVLTEWLAERDRRWVVEFDLLPYKGYATMHTLEIDLGDVPSDRRVVLLLDGWIDYADSSANIAAQQAGVALVPPRLYVADGVDDWREVQGLMGFPAGLPKTMAVDLTGALNGAQRIRIETNMRIYWDRARVMVGGERTPLTVRRLDASSAELRFGGFPREWSADGRMPYGYDPDTVEPSRTWKAHVGRYTAFGDVTGLVRDIDDQFVTTRNGDELELVFESPGPVPAGQTRTYLLYADGFGKDMDPNSAANNEVGPIPFHGMPTYPYGDEVTPPAAASEVAAIPARVVPQSPAGLPGAPPLDR